LNFKKISIFELQLENGFEKSKVFSKPERSFWIRKKLLNRILSKIVCW